MLLFFNLSQGDTVCTRLILTTAWTKADQSDSIKRWESQWSDRLMTSFEGDLNNKVAVSTELGATLMLWLFNQVISICWFVAVEHTVWVSRNSEGTGWGSHALLGDPLLFQMWLYIGESRVFRGCFAFACTGQRKPSVLKIQSGCMKCLALFAFMVSIGVITYVTVALTQTLKLFVFPSAREKPIIILSCVNTKGKSALSETFKRAAANAVVCFHNWRCITSFVGVQVLTLASHCHHRASNERGFSVYRPCFPSREESCALLLRMAPLCTDRDSGLCFVSFHFLAPDL